MLGVVNKFFSLFGPSIPYLDNTFAVYIVTRSLSAIHTFNFDWFFSIDLLFALNSRF